jgi:hypothetical protein
VPIIDSYRPSEANLLTTDVEPNSHRLATFES